MPSQDPREPHPVQIEVSAPKEEQDEAEIVLSLSLSGLGDVEVRLRSKGEGAPVKALFRAKDAASVRALSADLEALREDAKAQGLSLRPAASKLPAQAAPTEPASMEWQV